jgi:hypothetical protein
MHGKPLKTGENWGQTPISVVRAPGEAPGASEMGV